MRHWFPLALVVLACFHPTSGHASRARVEAAGSLEFILEDDTATLTPFRVGNPAGLALVPRLNRLDLSAQWRWEEFNYTWGTGVARSIRRTYSTLPAYSDNETIQYEGLTAFPLPRLAVQAGAFLYSQDDDYDFSAQLSEPNKRKGYVRAAYDLGRVQLGAEGRLNGGVEDYPVGPLVPGLVLEKGRIETQQNTVTGGILFRFPREPGSDQARWNVGGQVSLMPMSPQREETYVVYVEPLTLRVNLTSVYRVQNFLTWGPDLFYEAPGKIQAGVFVRKTAVEGTHEQSASVTTLVENRPEYKVSDSEGFYGGGGFKWTRPVSDGVDLKTGFFAAVARAESDTFSPDGTSTLNTKVDEFELSAGLGLSVAEDFAAGLQYSLRSQGGNETPWTPAGDAETRDAVDQSFVLGGEDWFSPAWAGRIGIVSELIENRGDVRYQADFFTVDPESRVFASVLTTGAGFKSERLMADVRLHFGQATYLTGDADRFATLAGALLTLTTFF